MEPGPSCETFMNFSFRTLFSTVHVFVIIRALRHYATSRNVAGSIRDEVIRFFNLPNPSSRTMALESTQFLTEMSTRNLPRGKGRPAHKADNLTDICEPMV
jgi:hypothetical protein